MYPWWQSLLFFCVIACSIAQREGSLSNDSQNAQTIEDSFFKIIFRSLKSPDVQHPVGEIPIWKSRVISHLLKRYPVSGQYGNLPRSQKWYSRRLFKRAAENPDAFMTAFKSAIKEALREILVENGALSPQSDTSALWSRVNENTGSLSSDEEVNFLRSIGFRTNDIPSDSVQPSLQNDTSVPAQAAQIVPAQAAQIWSTMRSPFTSSEATSVDSSSERVSLKSQPALQMQPSVTALPAGRTLSYYSNMTSTEKSKTYTEVTTAPGSSKAFNLRLLTSSYSRGSDIQESLHPITKDPFTMAANVVFENSTLRNILTSNFKSAEKLGSVVLPITETSSTSSGLANLIVTTAEGQFSPDGKTSSQTKHSMPQNDHTISPILVSASPYTKHYLSRSTFKIPRPSVLPTAREAFATSVSFASKNKFANFDEITSTKEKLIPALRMRNTSITSKMTIQSDLTVTQISSTYKSTSAGTSENASNEGALANTAGTLISTFSSPKPFSSTEGNPVSTGAVSFETDYEMLSSVTPLPIMERDHEACILKVRNATTTVPTPLAEQTSYENESTVSSARIRTSINPKSDDPYTGPLASTELASTVALSPFTDSYSTDQKENASIVPLNYLAGTHSPKPPKLDPTATVSSFTDTFPVSSESTTFPNTTTLSLPDYEVFQDAINGNVNSDQTTPLVTNTMSSTVLPFWFSKSLTSVTQSWKSTSPFFQREGSTALQITPRSQADLGPTRVTSTLSRYSTSPSVLNTVFMIFQLRNGTTVKHLGSTNTSGVFSSKMPESKTKGYNISSMPPKSSILYSSTHVTPQSQAISSTTRMRSAGSQSLLSTAMNLLTASQSRNETTTDISSLFTVSHLGNKTTKTHINSTSDTYKTSQTSTAITWKHQSAVAPLKSATSDLPHSKSTTRTERRLTVAKRQSYSFSATTLTSDVFSTLIHGNTSEAPAFKIWIPQSSDGIPTKSTTSFTASKSLREIQTTYNTTSSSISVLVAMPLTFHLTGISYSVQLGDHTTDEYKRLEREVILVLNKVFASKYQQEYVQAEILGFSNGSVVVQSKIAFNSGSSAPSASDIVRTVLTDNIAIKKNYFGWNINASTVQCNGYTIKNLQQESFSISFVVLHFGFIATSQNDQKKQSYLESLQKEVLLAVNATFPVTKVSFSQIRNIYGDLEVRGILYLQSSMFTNVQDLLSTLLPLANVSVDLSSINVDGMHKELKVYPFNFLLTNMQFAIKLLDMASNESQRLSKDLSKMIELALYDKSLLQVVVREFSGSVVCKGDLIYQFPAPGSGEILRQFIRALTSDGMLGSSTFKVDFQSVTIGDSTSSPYNEYTNFPGYAVAIIVMCGLTILLFPLLVYVCYKTRMLGHRRKETIRQRHDPDQQSHRLEMDNRAFRASIELP